MDWPFDQEPQTAAITTVGVTDNHLPILAVQHYKDEHTWGFFCGTTEESGDKRAIGMGEILELDPSLRSIANLPPGWIARRVTIDGDWAKEPDGSDT